MRKLTRATFVAVAATLALLTTGISTASAATTISGVRCTSNMFLAIYVWNGSRYQQECYWGSGTYFFTDGQARRIAYLHTGVTRGRLFRAPSGYLTFGPGWDGALDQNIYAIEIY
ncbi:hypothetical protein AB0P21_40870 [Kribbella sp. NPDC056861]|uniref:hypothetical protein n=1 Tax=Kribbella sp. NPDC056861 TaxID=3154857 RepID=UPI0034496873